MQLAAMMPRLVRCLVELLRVKHISTVAVALLGNITEAPAGVELLRAVPGDTDGMLLTFAANDGNTAAAAASALEIVTTTYITMHGSAAPFAQFAANQPGSVELALATPCAEDPGALRHACQLLVEGGVQQ